MNVVVDRVEATNLFWRHHLRIGFIVLTGESVASGVYFATTRGPHRALLLWVAVLSFVLGIITMVVVVEQVARRSWRETFSYLWTMAAGVALALVAFLDGGFGSPLLILVPVPVFFAAMAFSPHRVMKCGALALVEFVVVSQIGAGAPSAGDAIVWFAGGVGVTWLAVSAATNRVRLEAREHALEAELSRLATTDGLTGCLNHRAFTERLEEEVARASRHGWPLTVLVADIDEFKQINDTYGHPVGDEVLVTVAEALATDIRTGDFVGRMGGDEFIVALPNTPLAGGAARARRVQDKLRDSTGAPATVSLGISTLDPSNPSTRAMLEAADKALYHVKHTGRTGIATIDAGRCGRVA